MRKINVCKYLCKFGARCFYCFLLILLLGGCNLQSQPSNNIEDASVKNQIVYPHESEQFYVGDFIDIHVEINNSDGLTASILTINSDPLRRDQFYSSINNGDLYQPWIPSEPGVYALQVVLETTTSGQFASNIVNVYVMERQAEFEPDVELEEEVIEEPLEEECPEPIATTHSYANCRSGPGTAYEIVEGLRPEQSFLIVGKSTSGTWWQVEKNSSGATCWIWTKLVDICGDTDNVIVVGIQERDEVIEEEAQVESNDKAPAAYSACHDYPDFGTCNADSMGFGGCSWNTGLNQCEP
jgi:hypothetical protein